VRAFEKVSGKIIKYKIMDRRDGDIAECFADSTYAYKILGWKAEKNIEDMCKDVWRWQSNNPNGYN
jgi:UDP-glucose 4-epimerase